MSRSIKIFIILALALSAHFTHGQEETIKIYSRKEGSQMVIYANNPMPYPQTLIINLSLYGYALRKELPEYFVLPQKTTGNIIAELTIPFKVPARYTYTSSTWVGDFEAVHNKDYVYALPFEKDQEFLLSQGYDGKYTHNKKFELDFSMDEGTNVYAARGGVVILIKEDSDIGCEEASCEKLGNYITILHNDNTMADYYHLKQNGSLLNVGDKVQSGDLIGWSGSTGWTSGPHLHFAVKSPSKDGYTTFPTLFKTSASKAVYLFEGRRYKH